MKVVLIIFFTSLVIVALVFLLNIATYNNFSSREKISTKKDLKKEIPNEKKY